MMNNKRICCIFNIGAHYRLPIYSKMAEELSCDFYMGDCIETTIKTFDYQQLKGYKRTLNNRFLHHFYWQSGSISLILKPYDFYILDGEPYCLSSWCLLLLAKVFRKKTIAWTHGWYGRESAFKKVIKKLFYSLHWRLMIYNEYAIKLMVQENIPCKKMYCIANSLDSDRIRNIRNQLKPSTIYYKHFGNDAPVLIYCGRIQKRKKLNMLVDCLTLLNNQDIPANLVIVGADNENTGLASYIKQQHLEAKVWLYGPCYDENQISELFYNATVCISPGNVGLTAIHALSYGCPVITHGNFAYQMPEFEAIIPQVTGAFFQHDSLDDLCKTVADWLTYNKDKRETIRLQAYQEIDSKWNIHYQIETIKQVIEND